MRNITLPCGLPVTFFFNKDSTFAVTKDPNNNEHCIFHANIGTEPFHVQQDYHKTIQDLKDLFK